MFLYTTTTIINSANAVDVLGNALLDNTGAPVERYKDNNGESFTVIGTGTFLKEGIQSIYKRAYTPGVKEKATLTVTQQTAGSILRLTIVIKLIGAAQSDYVNFTYDFKQPLVVDIASTGVAADDAAEFAKAINKIKTEYGRSLFTASATGAVVTFTARTNDQRFKSIVLEKVGAVPLNTLTPEITFIANGAVTVPGNNGFGDDAWMLKSVMLPTYENTRHFGIIKDERPILGGNYSQYTLRYITKAGEDGVWLADDKSITTHVFWVKADQIADFETAITGVKPLDSITLTADASNVLTVTGAIGTVTYKSSDVTIATVAADGTITGVKDGTVTITATDTAGNSSSVDITIDVI